MSPASGKTAPSVTFSLGANSTDGAKNSSGKSSGKSRGSAPILPLGANDEIDDDFEDLPLDEIDTIPAGWRMEINSNGQYRWRWQMKDQNGRSITYVTKSGKTGYKRGSKYVNKNEAKNHI